MAENTVRISALTERNLQLNKELASIESGEGELRGKKRGMKPQPGA